MRFYVYDLIDPRTGQIFYVGKGTGRRTHAHVKAARGGEPGKKCDRIREILAAGLTVEVSIIREFDDESLAYAFERRRIAKLGHASLTNIAPGGGGSRREAGANQPPASRAEVIALFKRVTEKPEPKHGRWAAALHRAAVRALPALIENRA